MSSFNVHICVTFRLLMLVFQQFNLASKSDLDFANSIGIIFIFAFNFIIACNPLHHVDLLCGSLVIIKLIFPLPILDAFKFLLSYFIQLIMSLWLDLCIAFRMQSFTGTCKTHCYCYHKVSRSLTLEWSNGAIPKPFNFFPLSDQETRLH